MELDELKAGWSVLNERLQQQEIVNKRLLQEMICNRTNSARSRLLRLDVFGLVSILLGIIVVSLAFAFTKGIFTLPVFILLEIILAHALITEIYISSFLFRFDIESKKLPELLRLTLNYRLWVKRNQFISFAVVIVGIPVLLYFLPGELTHEVWRYLLAASIVIGGLTVSYFTYVYFYKPNIATIEKGLKELKEFEQE